MQLARAGAAVAITGRSRDRVARSASCSLVPLLLSFTTFTFHQQQPRFSSPPATVRAPTSTAQQRPALTPARRACADIAADCGCPARVEGFALDLASFRRAPSRSRLCPLPSAPRSLPAALGPAALAMLAAIDACGGCAASRGERRHSSRARPPVRPQLRPPVLRGLPRAPPRAPPPRQPRGRAAPRPRPALLLLHLLLHSRCRRLCDEHAALRACCATAARRLALAPS